MHYYQFNIGDYNKHTMHLSPIEDITYRRLLDMYYDTELPIPNNIPWVSRRLRIEAGIVKSVLLEFFEPSDDGYKNHRADIEIAAYHGFLEKQKSNGIKGGRPKKTHGIPKPNPNLTQNNPKQETLNTKQETIKELATNVAQTKTSQLSKDWVLPDEWAIWAKEQRSDLNINQVADGFKDYWISEAKRKADWFATWRNWIRKQRVDKQSEVYEAPWQKANRLRVAELTPRIARKDPNEKYVTDMEFFTNVKEIGNGTSN
jgi:uncharacterized protein YdaU (DUF1376 family)